MPRRGRDVRPSADDRVDARRQTAASLRGGTVTASRGQRPFVASNPYVGSDMVSEGRLLLVLSPGTAWEGACVQIGVVYPQIELGGDPTAVLRFGRAVEELGFDHLLAYDHVLGAVHAGRTPPLTGP
jgi:hypothetical protein